MTADLDKLIAAVEAGEAGAVDDAACAQFCDAGLCRDAFNAFRGSLDAAKALHVALLGDGSISTPGYYSCVWLSGKASVWDVISGASFHAEITGRECHEVSPARAWLLAILRAYLGTRA
jgi:hypothetical protein